MTSRRFFFSKDCPETDATLLLFSTFGGRREFVVPRSHLPFGIAGSDSAPCLLTASSFNIFVVDTKLFIRFDMRQEYAQLLIEVMRYSRELVTAADPVYKAIATLALDEDLEAPLIVYCRYAPNGLYWVRFLRMISAGGSDRYETETLKFICKGSMLLTPLQRESEEAKLSIVSDYKRRVVIFYGRVIDVFDCSSQIQCYSIVIPEMEGKATVEDPSEYGGVVNTGQENGVGRLTIPLQACFARLNGQEWLLLNEKGDAGKCRAVLVCLSGDGTGRSVVYHEHFDGSAVMANGLGGQELFFANCRGIFRMNLGPASLERMAREVCVARTKTAITRRHPYLMNYRIRQFYRIIQSS